MGLGKKLTTLTVINFFYFYSFVSNKTTQNDADQTVQRITK